VPVTRISEIVNERRGITADTALRLARHLGTTADLWMNLQKDYELTLTRQRSLHSIESQVRRRTIAACEDEAGTFRAGRPNTTTRNSW